MSTIQCLVEVTRPCNAAFSLAHQPASAAPGPTGMLATVQESDMSCGPAQALRTREPCTHPLRLRRSPPKRDTAAGAGAGLSGNPHGEHGLYGLRGRRL